MRTPEFVIKNKCEIVIKTFKKKDQIELDDTLLRCKPFINPFIKNNNLMSPRFNKDNYFKNDFALKPILSPKLKMSPLNQY